VLSVLRLLKHRGHGEARIGCGQQAAVGATMTLKPVGPVLFAAPVRSDGAADDGVAPASGVGEPPTIRDFSDEARGEMEECWRHRSKERQLQAFALSGVVKLAPLVGAGGSEGTGHLARQAVKRMLPVDRKVKREILV
jgi:hypothetical protein